MIKKIIVEILKNGVKIVDERIECFGSSSAGIKIAEICSKSVLKLAKVHVRMIFSGSVTKR